MLFRSQQRQLLGTLLSAARLNRMCDAEVLCPADMCYTCVELVNDVQNGVWSELKSDSPKIDPIRRSLQRAYLEILKNEFDHKPSTDGAARLPIPGDDGGGKASELRAIARAALEELSQRIAAVLPKVKDPISKAHLRDCASEIESILAGPKK